MKTSNSQAVSQKLAGNVEMARLSVATAERLWKAAKLQAREAKRRRKEVKLIASRARKDAKQAKADLAEAKKALTKAEAKLAKSGVRVATRKPAKARAELGAKLAVAAPKKKAAPDRKGRSRPSAPYPAPGAASQVKPASLQESESSPVPDQTGPATLASTTTEPPTTNP